MKTIERAHLPSKLWEKVKLPKNYQKALELVDEQLEFWSKFQRHKCKQRLTKLHQMIIRQRKLRISSMHTQEKLVTINKKYEKRETKREAAAEKAAMVDRAIEKELVQRLKSGTFYPQDIYNLNKEEFEEVLDKNEIGEYEVDEDEDEEEEENEDEYEYDDELDEDELKMLEEEEEKDGEDVEEMGEYLDDDEQGGKSNKKLNNK
jgi:protein MAK16